MDVTDPTKNRERWLAAIKAARDAAAVAELQTRLFGTKGEVIDFVRSVRSLPAYCVPSAVAWLPEIWR